MKANKSLFTGNSELAISGSQVVPSIGAKPVTIDNKMPVKADSAGTFDRIQQYSSWEEVAAAFGRGEPLIQLMADFATEPNHCFGIEAARRAGDRTLLKMALRQIIEDWENGDTDACSFMTLPLEVVRR